MKYLILLFLVTACTIYGQEVTLSHNSTDNILDNMLGNVSCGSAGNNWARRFVLDDFGVTGQLELTSGRIAFQEVTFTPSPGITVSVNVYEIDANFPDSFGDAVLLGSQDVAVPSSLSAQIIEFTFNDPVIVPTATENILVEVSQGTTAPNTNLAFFGGTNISQSSDFSWLRFVPGGCTPNTYMTTEDLGRDETNYFIEVEGLNTLSTDEHLFPQVSVYPNPTHQYLQLNIPDSMEDIQLNVFSTQGAEIPITYQNEKLDLQGLQNGVYFLKITSSLGTLVKKIVKD